MHAQSQSGSGTRPSTNTLKVRDEMTPRAKSSDLREQLNASTGEHTQPRDRFPLEKS